MAVYLLDDELSFPHPELSNSDGLLAVGGDLSVERLLLAYQNGIFPWFDDDDEILWWSPNPRLVLFLDDFKVSKSLRRIINSDKFQVKFNSQFSNVVDACASAKRNDECGTWITDNMKKAYLDLHKEGYAHSVEVYENGKLVGGLYGLTIGKVFCGESMFHSVSNASKIALFHLVESLKSKEFHFLDAQTPTAHLKSMGAVEMSRDRYIKLLHKAIE